MRKPLVAGNWKMHGSLASATELAAAIAANSAEYTATEVLLVPPSVHLSPVANAVADSQVALGGQNLCQQAGQGAYTGEVSGEMLKDLSCRYVLVGHSERRALYGESDETVAEKAAVARSQGLTPIICIGETEAEREEGQTEAVIAKQLAAVLNSVSDAEFEGSVVAYEPVWAIGTGKTASPEQAQQVHAQIRAALANKSEALAQSTRILYGGSVKAASAAELFQQPDIDGGLVGGASLDANEFTAIIKAANERISA